MTDFKQQSFVCPEQYLLFLVKSQAQLRQHYNETVWFTSQLTPRDEVQQEQTEPAKPEDLRVLTSERKEASGSEHSSLTLQASPESRGRAGSHSHGHTSTPPSTSQAPLFRSAGSPLLAQALSSCGAWA